MSSHLIIFILALLGIAEALYLAYMRYKARVPVCVIGTQCNVVWESTYSRTFGVPNEILGIIFYAVAAVIEWMLYAGNTALPLAHAEWVVLVPGFLMSCYYLYLEWLVLRAWCFWCTLSAVIVWLMLLVRLVL